MPRFAYKAKSGPKEIKEGVIDAQTGPAAAHKIAQMGYFPIEIKEQTAAAVNAVFSFGNKIMWKDLAVFTRQLADLLSSGLTILKALEVLGNQAENPRLRFIVDDTRNFVADGGTFSE